MTTENPDSTETALYVCRNCGDGFEDPDPELDCPECGGLLLNSALPHD